MESASLTLTAGVDEVGGVGSGLGEVDDEVEDVDDEDDEGGVGGFFFSFLLFLILMASPRSGKSDSSAILIVGTSVFFC